METALHIGRTAKGVLGTVAMTLALAAPALAQNPGSEIDDYDREMLTSLIEAVIAADEGDFVMTSAIPETGGVTTGITTGAIDRSTTGPVPLAPVSHQPATASAAAPVPQPRPEVAALAALPDSPGKEFFALQLASYGSPESAQRGFEAANQRYSASLQTHTLYVQPVDLGDRGVFHRLRIGGFTSVSEASDTCQALGIAIDDCMIVSGRRE